MLVVAQFSCTFHHTAPISDKQKMPLSASVYAPRGETSKPTKYSDACILLDGDATAPNTTIQHMQLHAAHFVILTIRGRKPRSCIVQLAVECEPIQRRIAVAVQQSLCVTLRLWLPTLADQLRVVAIPLLVHRAQ